MTNTTGRLAASCGQNFAAASACSNIAAIPQSDYQTFTYDLALNRPLVSAVGDGGQTKNVYNDTSSPLSSTRTQSITASLNLAGTTIFDGTGRTTQTRLTSDPDGADYTDTTYDSLGRVKTVSNPHRTTALSSDGITAYSYDPLGRVTTVILADGSTSLTSYSGNCVTVTDPSLKARKSCSDALGRLISVSEDPTGLNYLTTYSYDALDNLTSVVQAGSRNRTFTYNSLSQLLTAINPESGTLTYTYDSNGNVKAKVAPLPNQMGTSTVTTGYTYDALNRLTQKSYSDGSLAVYFYYDACSFCTAPITNGIGRLVHTSNNVNAAATYGYDPMGRVKTHSGCLPLSCVDTAFPINVNYDLAGDMTSYSVMGTTFTQTIDAAQRVTQISSSLVDAQHPSPLWTANATQGFYPHGAVRLATYGNGLSEAILFQSRLQPCRIDLNLSGTLNTVCDDTLPPTGNVQHLRYTYGTANNGNIAGMVGIGAQNFNRSYGYDALNRLRSMSAPGDACSGLSWTIDPWGNRTDQTVTGGTCNTFHALVGTNNRLSGAPYQYDAAGNMTHDASHSYTYNAENQITQVDAGATATYVYDPEGKRVQKASGGTTLDYLYLPNGNQIAEVNATSLVKGYVYQALRLVAEYENGTTYFIHGDHLGSTRLVTGISKAIADNIDYLPFGEQTSGDTITTHKFTGKERDSESGLDNFGARYDSSAMGRFMTPDWSAAPMGVPYADFGNPQSLNLYSYVKNNPLNLTDPTGHYELNASNCGDNAKCQKKYDKAANKFESRREKDLKSKKADVRAAAANFGARGEANGVHVGFANLNTGTNPTYGSVDASGSVGGMPLIQVTLDFGRAGNAETQTHEGTHVGDDQKFLNSYNPLTGSYDGSLNPTHGQTEFNAFRTGAEVNQEHGFGPNDTQKILNFLHSSPLYGPIFNVPVFDPNRFRAGVPDDEQQ